MANFDGDIATMASTLTIGSHNEPQNGQDHFVPMVEQIMAREKENQEAVRRLRDMIARDKKRYIQLKLALQTKKHKYESLTRENKTIDEGIKGAFDELNKLMTRRSPSRCQREQVPERMVDDGSEFEPLLFRLKRILNDLITDIRVKEDYLASRAPPEKGSGDKHDGLQQRKDDLAHARCLLDDLSQIEHWLERLVSALIDDVSEQHDSFSTFHDVIMRIIDLIDSCLALEKIHDKLKAKQLELFKNGVDYYVSKRLAERKPLVYLPQKLRHEFELIIRKRQKHDLLPAIDPDLVNHFRILYEYGSKQYMRDEQQLQDLMQQVNEKQEKANCDEMKRIQKRNAKGEELQKAALQLARLDVECKILREQVEKYTRVMNAEGAKTSQLSIEIRQILDTNQGRNDDLSRSKGRIEKEIETENEKRRQCEFAIDKLAQTKARQDDEMKKLDQQIRDRILANRRSSQYGLNRQAMEDRLVVLRQRRDEMAMKTSQHRRFKGAKRPKHINEAQKRRVEKANEVLQNKMVKFKDIERDCEDLRRHMKQLQSNINSIKDDLERKKRVADHLQKRLEEANADWCNLKEELKRQQELVWNKSHRHEETNRDNAASQVSFMNKNETHFTTGQRPLGQPKR